MPIQRLTFITLIAVSFLSGSAQAFDPFTAMTVAKTATETIGKLGETASGIDALQELYSEVDSEAAVSEEGRKLVQDIQEIESLATEAGYSADEVKEVSSRFGEPADSFQNRIRGITHAIRAGKRIKNLLSSLEQRAQKADIESVAIEKEQLNVALEQLAIQRRAEVAEVKKELTAIRDQKKQAESLRKELKSQGARLYGKTGLLTFPSRTKALDLALPISEKLRVPLLGLLVLVMGLRVIFYQMSFKGPEAYADILRDALVTGLLLHFYPDLVRLIVTQTDYLAASIDFKSVEGIEQNIPLFSVKGLVTLVWDFKVGWVHELFKYLCYQIAYFVSNFVVIFMILCFPLVIFASQAMNMSVAWPVFLGAFVVINLWPLLWNATGAFAANLWRSDGTGFKDYIFTSLFGIFQVWSPLLATSLLKGSGASGVIKSAASTTATVVTKGKNKALSAAKVVANAKIGDTGPSSQPTSAGAERTGRVLAGTKAFGESLRFTPYSPIMDQDGNSPPQGRGEDLIRIKRGTARPLKEASRFESPPGQA